MATLIRAAMLGRETVKARGEIFTLEEMQGLTREETEGDEDDE